MAVLKPKIVVFLIILLLLVPVLAQSGLCPELQENFGNKPISENVRVVTQSFRTAKDYSGKEVKLHADIYQANVNRPASWLAQRPLVVIYHGGGFKAGDRNSGVMKLIATYFAQRGYVAISADYRIGWKDSDKGLCGGGSQKDYLDAQYRAMQDERALIQYFKNQAKTIGFDTSRIFLFGGSSGATLVCSRLEDQWIAQTDEREKRLGPLEVFEGNKNYSTAVAGIMSFAGANVSPDISTEYNTPIAFFHGTCDNAVPYREEYLAGCQNMGYYYGPEILTPLLKEKGTCYRLYTYCGFGHDLGSTLDTPTTIPHVLQDVFDKSIEFMQSVMCGQCTSYEEISSETIHAQPTADCSKIMFSDICGNDHAENSSEVKLYPSLIQKDRMVYIHSNLNEVKNVLLNIYDMSGKLVLSRPVYLPEGNFTRHIQLEVSQNGTFLYQFAERKRILSSGKIILM